MKEQRLTLTEDVEFDASPGPAHKVATLPTESCGAFRVIPTVDIVTVVD